MRRRSKRPPNNSESTGKIGQEIPSNQPAPLVPSYLDDPADRASEPPQRQRNAPPAQVSPVPVKPLQNKPLPAKPAPVQAAPKRPESRPEPRGESRAESRSAGREQDRPNRHERTPRQARPDWNVQPGAGKLEVETQPDLPTGLPAEVAGSAQAPKGYVVLAIGLPGSGKTTWFQRRGVTPLSSDLLRGILFDDVEEQRFQGLVFQTLRTMLRARLIAKMPWNYVDATNLSIHERRQWIKMAKSFGFETQAVFFDVPLEVCLTRNSQRDRSVSEEVMRKMAERLRPPAFEEGFDKITVVRVKGANS